MIAEGVGKNGGEVGEVAVETFKASDGVQLAYYVDDFTDPWTGAPIHKCRLPTASLSSIDWLGMSSS